MEPPPAPLRRQQQLTSAICTYYANLGYVQGLLAKAAAAGDDLSAPFAALSGDGDDETSLLALAIEGCVFARRWNAPAHLDVLRALLDTPGVDPNRAIPGLPSPLALAIELIPDDRGWYDAVSLLLRKGAALRADDSPDILTRAARERGGPFFELLMDHARTLAPMLREVAKKPINFLRLFIQNPGVLSGDYLTASWACACLLVLHDAYGCAPPPPDTMRALAGGGDTSSSSACKEEEEEEDAPIIIMRRAVDRFIEALYERRRTAIALQRRFIELGIPHDAAAHIETQLLRADGGAPMRMPLARARAAAEARAAAGAPQPP